MKHLFVPGLLFVLALLAGCASRAEIEARHKLADTYMQLGVSYMQRGQLAVAKENIDKALELHPEGVHVQHAAGLLRWRLKEYPEAESHFRRALEADSRNPEVWNNLGVFLCERDRFAEADAAFTKALAEPLYRTPADANVSAGVCQMRKPAPRVAENYFRAALDINPNHPRALFELAKMTYADGRALSARAFMQRYFVAAPDSPETLLLAVRIENKLGNADDEASYAVRLRGKYPDSPEAATLRSIKPLKPPARGGKR